MWRQGVRRIPHGVLFARERRLRPASYRQAPLHRCQEHSGMRHRTRALWWLCSIHSPQRAVPVFAKQRRRRTIPAQPHPQRRRSARRAASLLVAAAAWIFRRMRRLLRAAAPMERLHLRQLGRRGQASAPLRRCASPFWVCARAVPGPAHNRHSAGARAARARHAIARKAGATLPASFTCALLLVAAAAALRPGSSTFLSGALGPCNAMRGRVRRPMALSQAAALF
jgi:hypothetical protein